MTLYTTDYLEYYLTLVGWIVNNGIWNVLVATGAFALPFLAIVVQEWLKARSEGADEGNKGVLSAMRIENRVWVAIVVILFAGIPFIPVDLSTLQFDRTRSEQCQVNVPEPPETNWSAAFTTLNDQSAYVPVWWFFMHALSKAVTGAAVAAVPCGTDLRQIRMDIDSTRIDDPLLAQEVADFLGEEGIVDARAVDVHADLPQIRAAGDGRHGRAGDGLGERVHEEPPDRDVGALIVERRERGGPIRLRRLRHVDLALFRARAIELERAQVDRDEGDAGEQDDHDRHPDAVLDTHGRQHALVAFVRAFRSSLEPLLHDDGEERQREGARGDEHVPDAVVDDPADECQVVLEIVRGIEGHRRLRTSLRLSPEHADFQQRDRGEGADLCAPQTLPFQGKDRVPEDDDASKTTRRAWRHRGRAARRGSTRCARRATASSLRRRQRDECRRR